MADNRKRKRENVPSEQDKRRRRIGKKLHIDIDKMQRFGVKHLTFECLMELNKVEMKWWSDYLVFQCPKCSVWKEIAFTSMGIENVEQFIIIGKYIPDAIIFDMDLKKTNKSEEVTMMRSDMFPTFNSLTQKHRNYTELVPKDMVQKLYIARYMCKKCSQKFIY